jgi:hypothetical protein
LVSFQGYVISPLGTDASDCPRPLLRDAATHLEAHAQSWPLDALRPSLLSLLSPSMPPLLPSQPIPIYLIDPVRIHPRSKSRSNPDSLDLSSLQVPIVSERGEDRMWPLVGDAPIGHFAASSSIFPHAFPKSLPSCERRMRAIIRATGSTARLAGPVWSSTGRLALRVEDIEMTVRRDNATFAIVPRPVLPRRPPLSVGVEAVPLHIRPDKRKANDVSGNKLPTTRWCEQQRNKQRERPG